MLCYWWWPWWSFVCLSYLISFVSILWDIYLFVSVCQTVQTLITIEGWIDMRIEEVDLVHSNNETSLFQLLHAILGHFYPLLIIHFTYRSGPLTTTTQRWSTGLKIFLTKTRCQHCHHYDLQDLLSSSYAQLHREYSRLSGGKMLCIWTIKLVKDNAAAVFRRLR